jgi:arsenite methyltransferase
MSNSNDEIRNQVKDAYAKAVNSGNKGGCNCGSPSPKGIISKKMGEYTPEELKVLPEDAVENSFGCGNPLAFSDVKEGDVVLDLGSGAGIDILIAAGKVGKSGKVIGVDMTPDMIKRAEENIKKSGYKNVEVRQGTIENLPVDDNSVDFVISNCVINLSPEKDKVFTEIFRVLKKGGKMQVSDIVTEKLPDTLKNIPEIYNSCIGGAVSEKEYINFIKNAGLTNVEIKSKFVYESSTLKGIVISELPETPCCSGGLEKMLDKLLPEVEGKVASVKVYAEKV